MNNDERKNAKRSFRMVVIFSAAVCFIFAATMILMFVFSLILYRTKFPFARNTETILLLFAFVSVIIGTILSQIVGRKVMSSISSTTKAAQEVAKGNFNITLDEDLHAEEMREMAHSFNLMTKELAKTEILRSDFISNVSHEFKTPLSTIEGYAMLLQNTNLTQEKRIEFTSKIIENVQRLSTLTGNILRLSKLENQDNKFEKTNFSLDEQIREIVILFESQWEKNNINLDIDLDSVTIYGNAELLSDVWQNLISNALKFTPSGGELKIRLEKHGNFSKTTITDNGIGMDKETMNRIFEKFYQGDSSHATKGNGLGLTLVKKIVDLHSGSIIVESELYKGTSFTVTLPTTL